MNTDQLVESPPPDGTQQHALRRPRPISIILGMLVFGFLLWVLWPVFERHAAAARLRNFRGLVTYFPNYSASLADDKKQFEMPSGWQRWLWEMSGAPFSVVLRDPTFVDKDMANLVPLTWLSYLSLKGTAITDAGLVCLRGRERFYDLDLRDTKIGDKGLETLQGLDGLSLLMLGGTQITDEGLKYLATMHRLNALDLSRTSITDAGLENIKWLWELDLSQTRITNPGLRRFSGLNYLNISGTDANDTIVEQLLSLRNYLKS